MLWSDERINSAFDCCNRMRRAWYVAWPLRVWTDIITSRRTSLFRSLYTQFQNSLLASSCIELTRFQNSARGRHSAWTLSHVYSTDIDRLTWFNRVKNIDMSRSNDQDWYKNRRFNTSVRVHVQNGKKIRLTYFLFEHRRHSMANCSRMGATVTTESL